MIEVQSFPLRFRIWDKEEKQFVRTSSVSGPKGWPCLFNLVTGCFEMESDERFVISQGSGVKDKHGKEVYIGDIIKETTLKHGEYVYGVVRYDCYRKGGRVHYSRDYDADFPFESFEVVGNIWENPELVKEGFANE